MDLDFNEEQEMLRKMTRDFLVKECPKTLVRELEESEDGYSKDIWQKMAELGWMGIMFPPEYDGMGSSFMDLAIILDEMGRNILPSPFFSTVILGGLPVMLAGSEEQKKQLLPAIANGQMIMTMALTEPSAGFNPADVAARAVSNGNGFSLSGTKLFVPDAKISKSVLVVARTKDTQSSDGISVFVVPADSQGVKIIPLRGVAMDNPCEVIFDNVSVSKDSVLGEIDKGWAIVDSVLTYAKVGKCAEMVGAIQSVLEMTNEYAKERVQYGKTIGSNQVIQHYLANMWIDVHTAKHITYEAVWKVSEGLPSVMEAATAKDWLNKVYRRITAMGVQIHGGIGTTRDHDVGLYYRRALASETAFGDSRHQRETVASLLGL